ncbi:MAG: DUF255 domain-containing protein [Candidatus Bathyarchaeia archaeon]
MPKRISPQQKRKPPERKTRKKLIWLDWSDEAFQSAQRGDKPILLIVTASWSNACRRFSETVLTDALVVDVIREEYVPIRVDSDRRPDVADRYNFGGYPTVAVLTPKGEILAGGTYLETQRLHSLLQEATLRYKRDKDTITKRVTQAQKLLDESAKQVAALQGELSEEMVWNVAQTLLGSFDMQYGGFGRGAKFPQPEALELSLLLYNETKRQGYLLVASKTLDAMMQSPLHDTVEGGFHGYSENREWTAPSYEKMLDVNLGVFKSASRLFQILGEAKYRDIAQNILSFMDQTLFDKKMTLYRGSQFGDVEYFQMRSGPRPTGRKPPLDPAAYAHWNFMAASAFAEASHIFNDSTLLDKAVRLVNALRSRMFKPDEGFCHFYVEGECETAGLLMDQAYALEAYVTLSHVTQEPTYLQNALEIVDIITQGFLDNETGALLDRRADPNAEGYLQRREKSLIENAVVARCLDQLSYLSGNRELHDVAGRLLKAFAVVYPRHDLVSAEYAHSVYLHLQPRVEVTVVCPPSDSKRMAFIREAFKPYEPRRIVQAYDPTTEADRIREAGFDASPQPAAYVSVGTARSQPILDPEKLPATLLEYSGGKTTP